jgi:bis(5'-nucleosyl)-tetraphosphatase (symmetrical)
LTYHSLEKILDKSDRDELIDWLRFRPLAHYDAALNTIMVHAGIPPQWTVEDTVRYAAKLEKKLQSDSYIEFLEKMYGDEPRKWSEDLRGNKRRRFIVNSLTRLRMIRNDGALDFSHKGPPEGADKGLTPWFDAENAKWRGTRIVFGHWSALGLIVNDDLIAVDTGCVWGRQLTAVRLDQGPTIVQVRCKK